MRKIVLEIILILFPLMSFAGPFGIEMGDKPTMAKFKDFQPVDGRPNFLIGSNPPKAHSAFEAYAVKFSTTTGACLVKGIGKDHDSDDYGVSTKSEIDKIAKQISSKYGKYEKTDMLSYGSIWDDANYWMMGVTKNQRFYAYKWEADTGATLENTGISSIFIAVQGKHGSTGYVVAEFNFDNASICDEEESQKEEDSF